MFGETTNHFLCKDGRVHHPIDSQPFINGWLGLGVPGHFFLHIWDALWEYFTSKLGFFSQKTRFFTQILWGREKKQKTTGSNGSNGKSNPQMKGGIYTWNPNDLCFWRDPTPQNKAEIPIKIRIIWVPGMCQGLNSHYFHIIGDKLIIPSPGRGL